MFVKFLLYLLRKWGYSPLLVPKEVREVAYAMRATVRKLDLTPHSGEWKKHQVYALALKWYPQYSKRDVSLGIEIAVRENV